MSGNAGRGGRTSDNTGRLLNCRRRGARAGSTPALTLKPRGADGTGEAWWLHQAVLPDGYCRALAAPLAGEAELILRTV